MDKLLDVIIGFITFGCSQRGKKDRKVFEKMIDDLPPDSETIRFLNEHDIGNPFRFEVIRPLNRVFEDWRNVDRVFINKKIENMKMEFLAKNGEFLHLLSLRSGGSANGFISIGIEDFEERMEMLDYRNELNTLATELHELYVKFYDFANRKLPV